MPALTRHLLVDLPTSGPTDPIAYYRRPLVGFLFRERINMGLRLLGERPRGRTLEIGYAAGAVLLTIAPVAGELHGVDLHAEPTTVADMLARRGVRADLRAADVRELPYPDGWFDLVVCYSVIEHLHEYRRALAEVARVLGPTGELLLGMPAVNRAMDLGFRAIGYKNIQDHHVTTPRDVARAFRGVGLRIKRRRHLGLPLTSAALYTTWLLGKTGT